MTSHERSVWYFSITSRPHLLSVTICYHVSVPPLKRPTTWRSSQASPSMAPCPQIWPAVLLVQSAWLGHLGLLRGGHPKIAAVLETMRRNPRDFEGRKTRLNWVGTSSAVEIVGVLLWHVFLLMVSARLNLCGSIHQAQGMCRTFFSTYEHIISV